MANYHICTVSSSIPIPSLWHFAASVSVFCVILCVSIPCPKPPYGWGNSLCDCSGLPCDWGNSLCGWSGLPCGWGIIPCDWGGLGSGCSILPCGRGHAPGDRNDFWLPHDLGSSSLPYCSSYNTSRPLFDAWDMKYCWLACEVIKQPVQNLWTACIQYMPLHADLIQVPVHVYAYMFRQQTHEVFVSPSISMSSANWSAHCHCTAISSKQGASYMKQSVVSESYSCFSSIHSTENATALCITHEIRCCFMAIFS